MDIGQVTLLPNKSLGGTAQYDYLQQIPNWQSFQQHQAQCSGDTHVRSCPHCQTCACGKAKIVENK